MNKNITTNIRNSTAEFLIFTEQSGENSIEVQIADNMVWLTQKTMSILYEVTIPTVNEHLRNLFTNKEIFEESTIRKFRIVQKEGVREVSRNIEFYNLEAIIAVGFRINSNRAIQFRQWAVGILKDFAMRGYVLDKERLKNGAFLDKSYFDSLIEEIREIRASERRFYQKITDIYATAMDYNSKAEITQQFFAEVQNKLHYAIHGHTAAELIMKRVDSRKEKMGLTSWKNAPEGKILKPDVVVAKNYLTELELKSLDRFVTMYLDYAEDRASRNIPMTMKDWAEKLNAFLQFNERDILNNPGKVSKELAKAFAESEFEKYRILQDSLFVSDFDKHIKNVLENHNTFSGEETPEFSSKEKI